MENRLSPLAEDVSSLELAESPWLADQLLFTASLRTQPKVFIILYTNKGPQVYIYLMMSEQPDEKNAVVYAIAKVDF